MEQIPVIGFYSLNLRNKFTSLVQTILKYLLECDEHPISTRFAEEVSGKMTYVTYVYSIYNEYQAHYCKKSVPSRFYLLF